jgi:spore maturation protein CgeB
MKILCVFGEHAYGDPARGEGYEHASFLPALRALGHEVLLFDSFRRDTRTDFAALNRALLETVARERPDVLLCVLMHYEVWTETLDLVRAAGPRLIHWSTDDSWKYPRFTHHIAGHFDLAATTCPEATAWYRADGHAHVALTQWGAPAVLLHAPRPAAQCRYPASFIGAAYGNRGALVAALERAGVEVACFGHGWPAGPVEAARIPEIVNNSVLSLNFSEASVAGTPRQIKARVFEVCASGGLLLGESTPGLEAYLRPGVEMACFDGAAQLVEQARRLLSDPAARDAIAAAGHARVAAEHTYERRFAELLALLPAARAFAAPDMARFEQVAAGHRMTAALRLLRGLLLVPFKLAFGKRGPRAARRALFELCWRIAPRHTYGARGLPGRLFYAES